MFKTLTAAALATALSATTTTTRADAPPTTASVLAATTAADWRRPDPERTLYIDLDAGRVVIELAPDFAPRHAGNIAALARAGWFDQARVVRAQDNYVVQWGRVDAEQAPGPRGGAAASLPAEFDRSADGLGFTRLSDGDVYAPEVGWAAGFPAARDPDTGRAWLAHCYGMVGAGRGMAADSSDGGQLYVVIGHAPRHLDRNITVVGRVLLGIEHLSVLPRGGGPLGFHEDDADHVPLRAARMAADLPESERLRIEVLRTDGAAFAQLVQARRHRHEEWFIDPVGRVELCNVPLPVRIAAD